MSRSLVVDLHGLGLESAMQLSSRYLGTDADSLTVITGRGLHSSGGRAVIKPELERYLSRNGYWWHHPESVTEKSPCYFGKTKLVNSGVIVVTRKK